MVTRNDVIADLQRVYKLIGRKAFSRKTYSRLGRLSIHHYKERFGTFGNALAKADLPMSRLTARTVTLHDACECPEQRRCLSCDGWFRSEDKVRFRCCPTCRRANAEESEDNLYEQAFTARECREAQPQGHCGTPVGAFLGKVTARTAKPTMVRAAAHLVRE